MKISVFHGTASVFSSFKIRPSGLHFGTFDQAVHAATLKLARISLREFSKLTPDSNGWNGRIIKCELDVSRILRVEDARTPSAWAALIKKVRSDFDCLVYLNKYEGRQIENSYVVFDETKVFTLNSDFTRTEVSAPLQ